MIFTPSLANTIEVQINFTLSTSSQSEYHWRIWKWRKKKMQPLAGTMVLRGNTLGLCWGAAKTPAVQQTAYLHMKRTNFVQITVVSTRRLPFLSLSPAPWASLMSILRQSYFVLFSWILPRWLRLIPSSSNWIKNNSVPVSLPILISHATLCKPPDWPDNRLTLHADLAPFRVQAPNSRFTLETANACSFLLFFSARTYVLLQKGGKCYSKKESRSHWILKEKMWVSSWKSVV